MSTQPVNDAEQFVLDVCRRTFLSVWCCNNPLGKPGKELCDVLVVCDPHVIIVSVKLCELKLGDDPLTNSDRWTKKAVDASVKQIYGAERRLQSQSFVTLGDGTRGLLLPPPGVRKVHRIAVAFGSGGWVPIPSGDFGKGFVHVLSENGFLDLLRELDTITDFVEYLTAKEEYLGGTSVVVEGGEQNLLGWYLANDRIFPTGYDVAVFDDTLWKGYLERPEVRRKKEADHDSYAWDWLVNELSSPLPDHTPRTNWELTDVELALRTMARERRFHRRVLSDSLREFLGLWKEKNLRARLMPSPSGVVYVVVCFSADESAEDRAAELRLRCYLARHVIGAGDTIIGIGFGEYVPGVGSSSDLVYMHLPGWCAEDDAKAEELKAESGYFVNATIRREHADEYPV